MNLLEFTKKLVEDLRPEMLRKIGNILDKILQLERLQQKKRGKLAPKEIEELELLRKFNRACSTSLAALEYKLKPLPGTNTPPPRPDYEKIVAFLIYTAISLDTFKLLQQTKKDKEENQQQSKVRNEEQRGFIVDNLLPLEDITLDDLNKPIVIEGISFKPLRLQEADANFINALFKRYGRKAVLSFVSRKIPEVEKYFFPEAEKQGKTAEKLVRGVIEGNIKSFKDLLEHEKVNLSIGVGEKKIYSTILCNFSKK